MAHRKRLTPKVKRKLRRAGHLLSIKQFYARIIERIAERKEVNNGVR